MTPSPRRPRRTSRSLTGDALRRTAGRPRLLVDRRALLHNVRTLRAAAATTAGQNVKLCGVIKADAYGHGAAGVADLLTNFYTPDLPAPAADVLAVATLEEALALPDLDVPVMVLRPAECVYLGDNRQSLEAALRRNVVISVISAAGAEDVGRLSETLALRASVQVMLDTGMHREMCPPEDFADVVAAVRRHPALQLVGVGTHFTDGELEDEPFSDEQLRHFHDAIDPIVESLPATIWKHAANSGGTFFTDDDELNMVRPGLAMYGIDPTCGTYAGQDVLRRLRPVAKWTAPVLSIREIQPGQAVGYNRTWTAKRPTRVGLVPVGYADGYRRGLGGRAVARIAAAPTLHGQTGDAFCEIIGRISMDYLTIDLSPAPWVQQGDEVILLDNDPASPCSATALAELCGTIPYEILCGIGPRVVRVAVNPADEEMG